MTDNAPQPGVLVALYFTYVRALEFGVLYCCTTSQFVAKRFGQTQKEQLFGAMPRTLQCGSRRCCGDPERLFDNVTCFHSTGYRGDAGVPCGLHIQHTTTIVRKIRDYRTVKGMKTHRRLFRFRYEGRNSDAITTFRRVATSSCPQY